METIQDIKTQVEALGRSKEFHYQKYLNNLRVIDEKMERIEKQMERTHSQMKRDLLRRHLEWYEEEGFKMDEAIEVVTTKYDSEIERLTKVIQSLEERAEKEKKSFEYNIEQIRKCCKNRSTATIFDALESVANALEIMKSET